MGLYIHVPFCQSRCLYCDFYSTTLSAEMRSAYVRALRHEMKLQSGEMGGTDEPLTTVYLGGGTPSVLSAADLEGVFEGIRENFVIAHDAEITIEANPDDVSTDFAKRLRRLGVNRVSLGLQTFDDATLSLLRRRHDSETARRAIYILKECSFDNISLDLIFGLPNQTLADFERDLRTALRLPITHLSAYALTYEEGTPLTRLRDAGRIREADEELSLSMYQRLCDITAAAGFEHYEISNFARPHRRSRHNSSYWTGSAYLGLGPAACSYDGHALRRTNAPNLAAYIRAADEGHDAPHDDEHLTRSQLQDERVFTALRTCDGLDLTDFARDFGDDALRVLLRNAVPHLAAGRLLRTTGQFCHKTDQSCPETDRLRLAPTALFVSDDILSDLMVATD